MFLFRTGEALLVPFETYSFAVGKKGTIMGKHENQIMQKK